MLTVRWLATLLVWLGIFWGQGEMPGLALDYCLAVAVTGCQGSADGAGFFWSPAPKQSAAKTLQTVYSLFGRPPCRYREFASGEMLNAPVWSNVQAALARLEAETDENDRVIVYLATALVRDDEGNLCLLMDESSCRADESALSLRVAKAVPLTTIGETIRRLQKTPVLVILDLCDKCTPRASQEDIIQALALPPKDGAVCWSVPEQDYWRADQTILSTWLDQALSGRADDDTDGHLRHEELIEFLQRNLEKSGIPARTRQLGLANANLSWEHRWRILRWEVWLNRLVDSLLDQMPKEQFGDQAVFVEEPTSPQGQAWMLPLATILAKQIAWRLRERGVHVRDTRDSGEGCVICGVLDLREDPARLVVDLQCRFGQARAVSLRDSFLLTGELTDLLLSSSRRCDTPARAPLGRGIQVEPAERTHPHFRQYEGFPVTVRFQAGDAEGRVLRDVEAVAIGNDCYLPLNKGETLRLVVQRRGEEPWGMLVLVDGANILASAGQPDEARFAPPAEHLANLNYFILENAQEYSFGEWITLGPERRSGPVESRRFVVVAPPDALGFRQPGGQLGEIRILLYPAKPVVTGERGAPTVGMGAGESSTMKMEFTSWRADDRGTHLRLVYYYRHTDELAQLRKHSGMGEE